MGLLFVIEGDEQAKGSAVDIDMETHSTIIDNARSKKNGMYPLIRRMNQYYSDIAYDFDELPNFISELNSISKFIKTDIVIHLMELCNEALQNHKGLEGIAD